MPHVVIRGDVDLRAWAEDFEPLLVRMGGDVLRADRIYVESAGRAALVAALVVEAGRKQPFYVKISAHDRGSASLRVDPMTHVERGPGVKALVAELGAELLRRTPGASVEVTNLVLPSTPRGEGGGPPDENRD